LDTKAFAALMLSVSKGKSRFMDIRWGQPELALSLLGQQVCLWRWELETDRVQWSDHLLEILGLDRSDYVENSEFFTACLHPDDHEMFQTSVERHLNTRAPYRFRCRLRHRDGHYVTLLTQGTTILNDQGEATEMIGTALDLTSQVEAMDQLLESERSFKSMAENVPGAIFRYIIHPDGTDELEYMSSGCVDIWEYTSEQLASQTEKLWASVLDADFPAMQDSVQEAARHLTPWLHRWRIKTPSGVLKHLEGRAIPVKLEDGRILFNSLILDVSEEEEIRRELLSQQEMLGQAQKMEAIGRISGGIAHDFNNLLAIVMGNAQLLEETVDEAERSQFIGEIVQACKRGGRLTRHLLSFARRSALRPELINLDKALNDINGLVARVIPEHIEVNTVQTAGLWQVEADVAFLENAILNLCINARDAMSKGGKLTIETSNVRISADYTHDRGEDISPGRYVMVAVTDTGTGISPSEIEKVVEPFYSTKGPDLGSGLGLAMVDGFVRQSNGALRIYSEVGLGTTVKLFLPATPAANDVAPRDRLPTLSRFAGPVAGRILVVEDEAGVLKVLEVTLTRAGYHVETATSGNDAFARFKNRIDEFDLLLTDVVMPGDLQGPALAQKLTELAPSLKVVFMSGYPNEAAVNGNGLRSGDRFLMKPILRPKLLSCLAEVLPSTRPKPR